MIEIIEHKDYTKATDGINIIEATTYHPESCIPSVVKLFKVFDGVWISPEPVSLKNIIYPEKIINLAPYYKDNCATIQQKSTYLKQMTTLFKRVALTQIGQTLLDFVSKGASLNLEEESVWNTSNTLVSGKNDNDESNLKFRVSTIVNPSGQFIYNAATNTTDIKIRRLGVQMNPELTLAFLRNTKVFYFDPAITLYHELLHICHSLYHMELGDIYIEEENTFGGPSPTMLEDNKGIYRKVRDCVKDTLITIKKRVDKMGNSLTAKYFRDKYGFIKNTIIDDKFMDNYLTKLLINQSEYKFTHSLPFSRLNSVNNFREDYFEDPMWLAYFKFDISDTRVYTVEEGFTRPVDSLEHLIKKPAVNLYPTYNSKIVTKSFNILGIHSLQETIKGKKESSQNTLLFKCKSLSNINEIALKTNINKNTLANNKYPLAVVMDSIFNIKDSGMSIGTISDLVKKERNGKRRWSI